MYLVNHQSNQPRQTSNMPWELWIWVLAVGGTFLLIIWAVFFGRDEDD